MPTPLRKAAHTSTSAATWPRHPATPETPYAHRVLRPIDLNTSQAFTQAPRAPDITQYTLVGIQKHKKPLRANTRLTQISAHTLGIGGSQATQHSDDILPVVAGLPQTHTHPSISIYHDDDIYHHADPEQQ